MSKRQVTRVVVVSAVVCLVAFFIGKAAVDWRLRHLDEALQKQVLETQVQADQPREYPLPNELVSALLNRATFASIAALPTSLP